MLDGSGQLPGVEGEIRCTTIEKIVKVSNNVLKIICNMW